MWQATRRRFRGARIVNRPALKAAPRCIRLLECGHRYKQVSEAYTEHQLRVLPLGSTASGPGGGDGRK